MGQCNNQPLIKANNANISFLICPICKYEIPKILLLQLQSQFIVKIKCSCMNIDQSYELKDFIEKINNKHSVIHYCNAPDHHNKIARFSLIKTEWYCKGCVFTNMKSEDNLIDQEIRYNCKEYKEYYNSFCHHCFKNVCPDCEIMRKKMIILVPTIDINYFDKELNEVNNRIKKNKNIKKNFLEALNSEQNKAKYHLNIMNEMKQKFLSVYHFNEQTNYLIKNFLQCLHKTVLTFKWHTHYRLYDCYQSIQLNNHSYSSTSNNDNNFEEYYQSLLKYYRKEHIIIIKETKDNREHYNCNKIVNNNKLPLETIAEGNLQKYTCIKTLCGHCDSITYLQKSSLDESILSKSKNEMKLWLKDTFNCIKTLKKRETNNNQCLYLNNTTIASKGRKKIIIWNSDTLKLIAKLDCDKVSIHQIIELNDNRLAASLTDGDIIIWSMLTWDRITVLNGDGSTITHLTQLNIDTIVSVITDIIVLWNMKTFECDTTIECGHDIHSILQLNYMSDDQVYKYAMVSYDHILLYDKAFKLSYNIKAHKGIINSLIQLADGRLASASDDKMITIWNVDQCILKCLYTMKGHTEKINCLIQLDDDTIASGSNDHSIKVWKI